MSFAGHGNGNDDRDPNLVCAKDANWRLWIHCQNLTMDKNDISFDSERYVCEKCGRVEYAYYDEMQ
jgi:hypothetical protein